MRAGRLLKRSRAPLGLLGCVALVACSRPAPSPHWTDEHATAPLELALERALPIEGRFEPSGLLSEGEKLLMVADKHDGAIFELRLGDQAATPTVFLEVAALEPSPLDLEGLARDNDGSWLLASEAQCRVLRATADGATSWATASVEAVGVAAGLFAKRGAGLEGLAVLPGGELLLAAEREPRGLLESSPRRDAWSARPMPRSPWPAPRGRPHDFADLARWQDRVFALSRNSHLVVELRKDEGAWREARAFSYARAENDPRLAYEDGRFGLGEGLAVDASHIYVALDNNRTARTAAPQDHRALLLVFHNPG